ncbi:MAG: hypothetical protein ACTSUR_07600 [Candidatus Heimdallarchaeaceae archaeon]
MNLNDVRGFVEINGVRFDSKALIKALMEQGLKIHPVNGSLLVGRIFIDPSPAVDLNDKSCPIVDHCKIFDNLKSASYEQHKSYLQENKNTMFPSLDYFGSEGNKDKNYIEKIDVYDEEFTIQDIFTETSDNIKTGNIKPNYNWDHEKQNLENYSTSGSKMIGLSPVTHYGNSKINSSKIPPSLRGKCLGCGSIVNIEWKHCAVCGRKIR